MSEQKEFKINIYEYTDFRAYLRDLSRHLKETRRAFSFRLFSRAAGFSSPNFLKLVMDGQRNLSAESIDKFARAFKLNKEEARFFRNLVQLGQAKTVAEKNLYAEELLKNRPYRELHPLKPAQFAYYSSWYLVAVRELIDTQGFTEDLDWIASQLQPPITVPEAKRALKTLEELSFVERTPSTQESPSRLRQKNSVLSTDDEVAGASVAQFHREMIKLASEAIDRFPAERREISAVTMSLSEEGVRRSKEVIQKARKELLEIAGQDTGQTAVYQLGLQLFPLSRIQAKKPEGS